jgi:tetratricopeptide (TPR) repeat protein
MCQLKVFVSHSSSDNLYAEALVDALREAGADVWCDNYSLDAGQLLDDIQRELHDRLAFVVVLSRAALDSPWVGQECKWAYNLYNREPQRILLSVVASTIEPSDFSAMLFLNEFKRVDGPGTCPCPQAEAIERTLWLLGLTPLGRAPTLTAPQPTESTDDLVVRGKGLLAQEQYAQAATSFEQATRLTEPSAEAWTRLALALNKLGRFQEALASSEKALAIDSRNASAWARHGAALTNLGQHMRALAACKRALALDPNDAIAWFNEGIVLRKLARYSEALTAYDHALALDSNAIHAWNGKGIALGSLNRHEEALVALDRALALDANYASAYRNKAVALRALGRDTEAEDAERRAKELGG